MRHLVGDSRTATLLLAALVAVVPSNGEGRPAPSTEEPTAEDRTADGRQEARQGEATMERLDSLRGSTVRWTFTEGPTAGTTYEHTFHEDGSVVWRVIEGPAAGRSARERQYAAFEVGDDVHAVSYLGDSGYTLTVILDLGTGRAYGFASNEQEWYPLSGTFEVVAEAEGAQDEQDQ